MTAPATWTLDHGSILRRGRGAGRKAAVSAAPCGVDCFVWTAWAGFTIAKGTGLTEAKACARAERWLQEHP